MKIGDLVKFNFVYRDCHLNYKIAVFLGEDVIHRQDGIKVVNYKCYVNGGTTILDKGLLKHMRVYNENR